MSMVLVGNKCSVNHNEVSIVVAISEMLEKTILEAAKKDGKLVPVRGLTSARTAVFLRDGWIILTPLSEAKVRERIHAVLEF